MNCKHERFLSIDNNTFVSTYKCKKCDYAEFHKFDIDSYLQNYLRLSVDYYDGTFICWDLKDKEICRERIS
jgi:hypothetical protein